MSRKCGGARAAGRIPAALSPQRGERAGPVGRGRAAVGQGSAGDRAAAAGGSLGAAGGGGQIAGPRLRPAGAWPGSAAPLALGRGRGAGAWARSALPRPAEGPGEAAVPGRRRPGAERSSRGTEARG